MKTPTVNQSPLTDRSLSATSRHPKLIGNMQAFQEDGRPSNWGLFGGYTVDGRIKDT